jgi:hypothetical protein
MSCLCSAAAAAAAVTEDYALSMELKAAGFKGEYLVRRRQQQQQQHCSSVAAEQHCTRMQQAGFKWGTW